MRIKICEKYPENRLFCLDLLRGIDMMLLLCFGSLIHAIRIRGSDPIGGVRVVG